MFSFMILFVLLAIAAGYFGFFALAGTAAWIAKVLFFHRNFHDNSSGVREAARGQPPV